MVLIHPDCDGPDRTCTRSFSHLHDEHCFGLVDAKALMNTINHRLVTKGNTTTWKEALLRKVFP